MSTEVANNQAADQTSVVAKKRQLWADMGEAIHKGEMQLQAQAQSSILKIKMPEKVADIQSAEVLLKQVKADQKAIEANRKQITSRLDDVCGRLMNPEKSLSEPIVKLNSAIIDLKREYERIEAAKLAKSNEIRDLKLSIKSHLDAKDFELRSFINEVVNGAFQYAITTGVKPEEKKTYLDRIVKQRFGLTKFDIAKPEFRLKLVQPEEMDLILEECWKTNPNAYYNIAIEELNKKFSDYDVAFQNQAKALELAREEEASKAKELEAELENKKIAGKLEAASTPMNLESGPEVKALKKSFIVDMPETLESALTIMASFSANLNLCLPKVKITKWFSFTPSSAAIALSKVKCDDNSFSPSGINFKEVDKL